MQSRPIHSELTHLDGSFADVHPDVEVPDVHNSGLGVHHLHVVENDISVPYARHVSISARSTLQEHLLLTMVSV